MSLSEECPLIYLNHSDPLPVSRTLFLLYQKIVSVQAHTLRTLPIVTISKRNKALSPYYTLVTSPSIAPEAEAFLIRDFAETLSANPNPIGLLQTRVFEL